MKKNIFLAILFFLGAHFTYATIDIQSTFYTTNDGLGNNFVRHIYQDSKGFMWFSTINGLTRYDGHSFVYFQPGKESEISLLDPHVRNVEEDKNHFLWIQLSPESFSCYDLRKEQFIDYTGTGDYRKKFANKYTMSNGDTWLSKSEQGCRRLTYINGKYQSFVFDTKNKLLPSNNVTKIIEGPNHNVFIGTDNGLVKYADGKTYAISDVKNIYDMLLYHNTLFILTRDGIIYQLKDNETLLTDKKLI